MKCICAHCRRTGIGVLTSAVDAAQWPIMLIIARIGQGAAGAMVSPAVQEYHRFAYGQFLS
jgi:MFS family permease